MNEKTQMKETQMNAPKEDLPMITSYMVDGPYVSVNIDISSKRYLYKVPYSAKLINVLVHNTYLDWKRFNLYIKDRCVKTKRV